MKLSKERGEATKRPNKELELKLPLHRLNWLHLRVIAFEKLGSVYRGGEERELNFLSTTATLYNTRATMQKYATAVHNREYCAYQTNMCKNKDTPPVEPKHHPYISGIICTISTPAFTLSNGHFFSKKCLS